MSSKGENVESILREFVRTNSPYVTGVAVATPKGLPIAVEVGPEIDTRMFSAQLAAIVSAQSRVVSQLGLGGLRISTVEADEGSLVVKRAGDYMIGVLISREANLGLVMIELDRLAGEIDAALAGAK